MNGSAVLLFLASVFALAAAVFIFDQHVNRPRPYKLMWSLGLLFYGIAALAQGVAFASHFVPADYKMWYYFGGILTAAFLGLGSFYLLGPRKWAHIFTGVAVVVALYAAVRIVTYSFPASVVLQMAHTAPVDVTKAKILPGDMEICAVLMNIPGALFLFGGAVYSAWNFYKQHMPGYRLASMVLLALGAVFPGFLTGFQALGHSGGAALGEFIGALCLLGGLLISLDVFTVFRVPFTKVVLHERRPAIETPNAARS